jgi:hypothetical protein
VKEHVERTTRNKQRRGQLFSTPESFDHPSVSPRAGETIKDTLNVVEMILLDVSTNLEAIAEHFLSNVVHRTELPALWVISGHFVLQSPCPLTPESGHSRELQQINEVRST